MPRPNEKWIKKYGKPPEKKKTLLNGNDDILSAAEKLAQGVGGAQAILLQALRRTQTPFLDLLVMDDIQLYGDKIVRAYHEWANGDYDVLLKGIRQRDSSLIKFLG